ncbi:MAG: TIGR00730 family Rossman fold protein [Bacteroidota bacterium]
MAAKLDETFPFSSICVYCGSSTGEHPGFAKAARELGTLMAKYKISLLFGGGKVGLMGVIADAVLQENGTAIGVIPQFLQAKEVGHDGLTEMIVTETMHERKQILADRSEAFIAMPGGFGTMDELCEILTWAQLGLHAHPIGILNVNGYYDELLKMFDGMVENQFLRQKNREMLIDHDQPKGLLEKMAAYQPEQVDKWI